MRLAERTVGRRRHRGAGAGRLLFAPLILLLLAGCQGGEAPKEQAPVPRKALRPRSRQRLDAQRAFGGNIGRVNVMVVAGKGYTDLVRAYLPLFPLVVHITNAGDAPVFLSREKDRFAIRTVDGRLIERTDLWQRGDWMTALAALPADFRAKFRYPDSIHPGAAVEFTVTFDAGLQPTDISGVEVGLSSSGKPGIKLQPIKTASEERLRS